MSYDSLTGVFHKILTVIVCALLMTFLARKQTGAYPFVTLDAHK
jgi:hypothetical protein